MACAACFFISFFHNPGVGCVGGEYTPVAVFRLHFANMSLFGRKRIYMDYASAPPVLAQATRAMREAERFIGNPGAIHAEGAQAAVALENARERVAAQLEVKAREIIFTSGLTEANNLAILGVARSLERTRRSLEGTHWLVSAIEHTSVLDCFGEVERLGGSVGFIAPDHSGRIMASAVRAALRSETVLVSVGWGNNEIGTLQQLGKIRTALNEHGKVHKTEVLFHSDAGQAPLYAASTAHSLGVDLLSVGANKLYGPHGVGALYVGGRASLARIAHGGPQERKLRPGTESVALSLGFAAAYERISHERAREAERLRSLRDTLSRRILTGVAGAVVNGDARYTMPHMLNISIPDIRTEYLTLALDRAGIAVSTKSACREGEESESHVVAALGGEPWRARNTIRLSLGRDTRPKDVAFAARTIVGLVNKPLA